MSKLLNIFFVLPAVLLIASCGGGGGGGSTPAPVNSLSLSIDVTEVLVGSTVTLTWASTVSSCSASASGSWSGAKASSGSETITVSTAGVNTFALTCGGANSSTSVTGFRNANGVVVDGYLSDATVFIDSNSNFQIDGSEASTTSSSAGAFSLRHANGMLVSLGGTDVATQTLLTDLVLTAPNSGYLAAPVITPLTSIISFMENPDNIYAVMGLDSSIDILTTDPVASLAMGPAYEILYEKGNQLTVLTLVVNNLVKNLSAEVMGYAEFFEGLAEILEEEFTASPLTKVDIESRAFITTIINAINEAGALGMSELNQTNTINALVNALPLIQVKANSETTTSLLNFSLKTLQTDIVAIASGSASAELVNNYANNIQAYVATTESIDSALITPTLLAFGDSATTLEDTAVTFDVANNDSLLSGLPFTLAITVAPLNGTVTISGGSVTYTPGLNFNGDDSFTYSVTQNSQTVTAEVSISITPVNDAPSIDSQLTIRAVDGSTALTDLSISDVDGDELTVTIGGTDAESFEYVDGAIVFKTAPDSFSKNSYSITVSVSDGTLTTEAELSIAVRRTQTEGFVVPRSVTVIETL
tara:strand:- start:1029 stop:2795 length:1767 start_codon:yes stop_codon:yes gene_type:complete